MKLTKHQRQHRVARLLEGQPVGSQAQLVELLATEGIEATQTTVSRDLEELGAVKVRLPGGETAYALPELPSQQIAPEDHLRRVLGEWAVEVAPSRNLVVLRTPPGCAHVVGSALDRSGLEGILGTVAGDDTVLVVVDEQHGGQAMAAHLAGLAGLHTPWKGVAAGDRDRIDAADTVGVTGKTGTVGAGSTRSAGGSAHATGTDGTMDIVGVGQGPHVAEEPGLGRPGGRKDRVGTTEG